MKEKEYIESIHIRKMFNCLDYNIHFPKENVVSILTGPNGCGKTMILNTINELCVNPDFPVKRFNIVLSNGAELNLCKNSRILDRRLRSAEITISPIMISSSNAIITLRSGFYLNALSKFYAKKFPKEKVTDFLNIVNEDTPYKTYLDEDGFLRFKLLNENIDILQLSDGYTSRLTMWYIILFYEEAYNRLLLIDTPETFQHICVQEKFIDNLINVCEKYEMRAIVATHSPNIVNNHADLILDKNGPKYKKSK